MGVAPSGSGFALGFKRFGSALGFASAFSTCEADLAERRANAGERLHTAKSFFADEHATFDVRIISQRS
jgi:hypothetical protein